MTADGRVRTKIGGLYKSSPSTLADGERDEPRLTSAGLLRVAVESTSGIGSTAAGDVAHDAADSGGGGPVKIGGKGSAAVAAAVTEGDRVNASFTLEGRLRTTTEGTIAHDAADAGNPIKVGGKGNAAAPGDATEGDRVDASFDLAGRLRTVVRGGEVAHDGADAGNPLKMGARAVTDAALVAAMTANDRSDLLTDLNGRLRVIASQPAASWSVVHNPGANTQATASKALDAAARHVCKGFMVSFASLGAPTPEQLSYVIRDGATGAGSIIWSGIISLPAVAGESKAVTQSGLYLVGTINTAMTIEFSAAGGANDYQAVSMFGESIPA